MEALRKHPIRWGVVSGIIGLTALQFVVSYAWLSLFPDAEEHIGYPLGVSLWYSLLPNAMLGILSVQLYVGWNGRDCGRIHEAWQAALWATLFIGLWTWLRFEYLKYFYWTQHIWGTPIALDGPEFISWQMRLASRVIGVNVPLPCAVALAIAGRIAANQLAHEQKRAQQFAAPAESSDAN